MVSDWTIHCWPHNTRARAQMFEELNQMAGRIWIRGITKELLLSDKLTRFVDELRAQTGPL